MIIPPHQLHPDTLRRLIEELVTRDGTELTDASRKIDHVIAQLNAGSLLLDFDLDSNSATVIQPPNRSSGKHS